MGQMALLFIRLDDGRTAQDSLAHRSNRRAPVTAARSRHRARGVRASDCANGATGRRPAGRSEWPAPSGRTGRRDTTTAVRRHSRQLSVVPGRLKPCHGRARTSGEPRGLSDNPGALAASCPRTRLRSSPQQPPNLAPKAVVGRRGWWRYSSEVQQPHQPALSGGDLVRL
jgi:hypothetical protein